MTTPLFLSVIVPTHNRLDLLKQTLACLWQQTYPSEWYEIIVVDNGSQDGTAEYLTLLAQQRKLHYIRQPPLGPGAARNAGVAIARGNIVVFTDDDCLPETGWLAALAGSYNTINTPTPVAIGGKIKNINDGHWLHLFYEIQDERQTHLSNAPSYLDTANASFDRTTFLQVGGFRELVAFPATEDVDLSYRFKEAGYELAMNDQATVWHIGRTTLLGLLQQSLNRGQGFALIAACYPEVVFGSQTQSTGWRLTIRQGLDALAERASQMPAFIRPWACGLAAAIRSAAYILPLIAFLAKTRYPQQFARCRALVPQWHYRFLYFALIVADNSLRLIGQLLGSFQYAYQQAKNGTSSFHHGHSADL